MTLAVYAGFVAVVLLLVLVDLGVLTRGPHVISAREAALRTLGWMGLALGFNVFVYFLYERGWFGWHDRVVDASSSPALKHAVGGAEAAGQFLAGYLLEQSLSVDNMMVIAIIFGFFRIPMANQHRVLLWGIVGALVLRGVMIGAGAALIVRFSWLIYVFGALLLVTAVKLLITQEEDVHPERNLAFRIARRLYPVSSVPDGDRFFTRLADGTRAMTPMFLALLLVETSDVIFAVDSIPAVFGITTDPFIVFTSNVFAILGLRSLYFALAGFLHRFHYLKPSLVFVLAFVGVKMLISGKFHIPTWASLAIIAGILVVGVVASIVRPERRGGGESPSI
ncbi:MAG: TerC family protein [Phycisphaerales bacterium]